MATSPPDLRLPDQLTGAWEHALVMSYGLDLPFFERALARQLRAACRNRILLADERTYLASCDVLDASVVRGANRLYVAEPILRRAPSHAKVMLLTSAVAGRLLVGSGNVSRQGFASGGELFCRYDRVGQDDDAAMDAFAAVRLLLERLRDDGCLTPAAAWHVDRLLEGTPWLFGRAPASDPLVRHTLDRPLAAQLADATGGAPVSSLTVLAPFYDEELSALADLVLRLAPARTTVLVQPGRTSIDPAALVRLRTTTPLEIRAVMRPPKDPYLHAKLVIARGDDYAVCLQGSANVSAAALLRHGDKANLEVVNLLRAADPAAFDGIVAALDVGPAVGDLESLALRYEPPDDEPLTESGWILTSGEWIDDVLALRFRGTLPALDGAVVRLAEGPARVEVVEVEGNVLRIRLIDPEGVRLRGVTPVRLVLADGGTSNAILPADREALAAALELGADDGERLSRLGDLELDDDELEQLLDDLEGALVIDARSVWQMTRGTAEPPPEGDAELRLAYEDIDYELLRTHPRMQQYRRGAGGGTLASRLQIALNAITSSFAELAKADAHPRGDGASPGGPQPGEEDERRRRVHWSAVTRRNVLFRNFVGRFLRGLASPEFQAIAGPDVLSRNAVLFLHLLSRLLEREWVDERFVIQGIARLSGIVWGTERESGWVTTLDPEEQALALDVFREMHSDAELLVMLGVVSSAARIEGDEDTRVLVRDAWRGALANALLPLTPAVLADAGVHLRRFGDPRTDAAWLADVLVDLAAVTTREEQLVAVEGRAGARAGAGVFENETVRSPTLGVIAARTLRIEDDEAELGLEDARWALQTWMAIEQVPHYRLAVTGRDGRGWREIAFYEPGARRGVYASKASGRTDLVALPPAAGPWEDRLLELMDAADQAGGQAVRAASR